MLPQLRSTQQHCRHAHRPLAAQTTHAQGEGRPGRTTSCWFARRGIQEWAGVAGAADVEAAEAGVEVETNNSRSRSPAPAWCARVWAPDLLDRTLLHRLCEPPLTPPLQSRLHQSQRRRPQACPAGAAAPAAGRAPTPTRRPMARQQKRPTVAPLRKLHQHDAGC